MVASVNVSDERRLLLPVFVINFIALILAAMLEIIDVDKPLYLAGCAYFAGSLALLLAKSGNIMLRLVANISTLLLIAIIIAPYSDISAPIIMGTAIVVAIIITIAKYRTPTEANDTDYTILVKQQSIMQSILLIPLLLVHARHLMKIYEIDNLIKPRLIPIQDKLGLK